jgi:hypothetical protein
MAQPVGTKAIWPGLKVKGAARSAARSRPAAPAVPRLGKGQSGSWLTRLKTTVKGSRLIENSKDLVFSYFHELNIVKKDNVLDINNSYMNNYI